MVDSIPGLPRQRPNNFARAKLFLLRHGAIDNPDQGMVGQIDLALSRQGRAQARRWAKILEPIAFERIVASDLARTRDTATVVAGGRPVEPLPVLREINLGVWEGLTREQIKRRYPDLWVARWQDLPNCRPPQGESFADLAQRVVPAVMAIGAAATGPVLIVTHAGVIRVVLCHLLGMDLANLFRIGLDYGALNLIDPEGPAVLGMNLRPEAIKALPLTDSP